MERLTQMDDTRLGYHWDITAFCDMGLMEDIIIDKLGAYEDTGLTPEEIEQNKEYIQILEKENKLIKEQYIKEADAVDYYKKLAKENEELKKEVKLWEQGREAIANQAKLVEKISFENSKKYFEEKVQKGQLAELLKLAVEDIKSLSKHFGICHYCINSSGYCNRCKLGKTVNASFCNDWQWQHADKLKELGVKV